MRKIQQFQLQLLNAFIKALPQVCMKYTAQDERRVGNIAHVQMKRNAILFTRLSTRAVYFHANEMAVVKRFILTSYSVNKVQFFGHFNTFIK